MIIMLDKYFFLYDNYQKGSNVKNNTCITRENRNDQTSKKNVQSRTVCWLCSHDLIEFCNFCRSRSPKNRRIKKRELQILWFICLGLNPLQVPIRRAFGQMKDLSPPYRENGRLGFKHIIVIRVREMTTGILRYQKMSCPTPFTIFAVVLRVHRGVTR